MKSEVSLGLLLLPTQVLLGLLTGSEKQFSSRSNTVNSQEPYNILPLASSQIRWVRTCVSPHSSLAEIYLLTLLLCRFGLLPLSMSNVRKSKSASRAADAAHQLVSPRTGPHALTVTVVLPHGLMLSVTPSSTLHSALLSTRTPGKLLSAGCVCRRGVPRSVFSFGVLLCQRNPVLACVFTNQPLCSRASSAAISWISSLLSLHHWTNPCW